MQRRTTKSKPIPAVKRLGGSVIVFCLLTVATAAQAAQVSVYPGQNLESIVSSYPGGTTFVLMAGIHRMQHAVPRSYDQFVGESGAVMNGSLHLTSFWQSGSNWVAHVSIPYTTPRPGVCDGAHPLCDHPEDLFFDNIPLTRVVSVSQIGPGRWFLDYTTGDVYIGGDPSGHNVEISRTPYAFYGAAKGVKISNLVIEKYATPGDDGAVGGDGHAVHGPNWTVTWNDIRLNHGIGLRIGDYMLAHHNKLHDNGELGFGGTANYARIENNEVYNNNFAGYNHSYGGGSKITYSYGVSIRYNYVHDNHGPGLWADIANMYTLFESNHTTRNNEAGILVEISYHTAIRYNKIEYDAADSAGSSLWWGAGILVNSSPYSNVYGNTVSHCKNGIGAIQSDRGSGPYGEYLVQNLNVHDNIIYQVTGTASGIVKGTTFDNSVYTSWNNHFTNNVYYIRYPDNLYFYWLGANHSLTWWDTYYMLH